MKAWLVYLFVVILFTFFGYQIDYYESLEYFINGLDYYYLLAISIPIAFSGIVSLLPIKNQSFKHKFEKALIFSSTILFIYYSYFAVLELKYILDTRERFRNYAFEDIKNDKITYRSYGFPFFFEDEQADLEVKKDSVRAEYGIHFVNDGCMYSSAIARGSDLYDELVEPYLEKRNGKDWRSRMEKDLNRLEAEK